MKKLTEEVPSTSISYFAAPSTAFQDRILSLSVILVGICSVELDVEDELVEDELVEVVV